MEEASFKHIKAVVNSILTSSQRSITISQLLDEYHEFEGHDLPYKNLKYSTVFDFLNDMSDILKIPRYPSLNSYIQTITNEKTSHIRELIVLQKSKKFKKRSKRDISRNISYQSFNMNNDNSHKMQKSNQYKSNVDKNNGNTIKQNSYKARGYNYIKHNLSHSLKPKGFVTKSLQRCIEDLCNKSENTSVAELKLCLLNHQDYDKLNVSNYQDGINMLKYFIYIDKGGVYLKNSPHEIFPRKNAKPFWNPSIINEDEEYSADDEYNKYAEFMDDDNGYCMKATQNSKFVNNCDVSGSSSLCSKSNNSFIDQKENANGLNQSCASTTETVYNKLEHKYELQTNKDERSNYHKSIDYKKIIVSIIRQSSKPVTVNQVLNIYKHQYGYDFPFQKLSCRSCMDYFRLYPTVFKLDDPYSTNSIVRLKEMPTLTERKYSNRQRMVYASILSNDCDYDKVNKEKVSLISKNELNENYDQPLENNFNALSVQPKNEYEKYDSDMVLSSMKEKMRTLLAKYKHGILCDEFMDIYAKAFGCGFVYNEYGFKSMKDMAYQLPSVFYVKDEDNQCTLYNAQMRDKLENNLNDPSEFYKNIPKTVLCNLSNFFQKYSNGVDLDDLNNLYCSEYGRSYDPIKYGYTSEKHMFRSLNKMVTMYDNKVYTVDPYAYTYFMKSDEPKLDQKVDQEKTVVPSVPDNSLLSMFVGSNICHEKFKYIDFKLRKKKKFSIYVAEIYSPGLFYIQMASDINNLTCFMNELQTFYDANEEKYSVLPEHIKVGLPCVSRFEETVLWHRAKVINIVDDMNVTVLYVDYGTIEVITKSKIKFLDVRFGALPIQSLPCTLFKDKHNYSRQINDLFAELVDDNRSLIATIKDTVSIDNTERHIIDLVLCAEYSNANVNKIIDDELKNLERVSQESVRQIILKTINNDKNLKYDDFDEKDDEDSFYEDEEFDKEKDD